MTKSQFLGPKWRNFPFSGVPHGKAATIAQKIVEFQALACQISCDSDSVVQMISISAFLSCAILSALESSEMQCQSTLHQKSNHSIGIDSSLYKM